MMKEGQMKPEKSHTLFGMVVIFTDFELNHIFHLVGTTISGQLESIMKDGVIWKVGMEKLAHTMKLESGLNIDLTLQENNTFR